MSYSDDYVSVDLAITFVILDTLNIFLIENNSKSHVIKYDYASNVLQLTARRVRHTAIAPHVPGTP